MQQKSFPYWSFGVFGIAFVIFIIVWLSINAVENTPHPIMYISAGLYGVATYFLIRKALRIDRNNRLALKEGVLLEADVVKHSRSFNMFSSTRYYVVEFTFTHQGKTHYCKTKTSDADAFVKHPTGSKINVLFHEASGSTLIEK